MRNCKQCGEIKPNEQFRPYYGGRSGRYKVCLLCEKVNTRFKYLRNKRDKSTATPNDLNELAKIEQLYDLLRQRGLQPPESREATDALDLDTMLAQQQEFIAKAETVGAPTTVPAELLNWLENPLTGIPVEELEETGEYLIKKYRPTIGFEEDGRPKYDETYRDVINKILRRFDDYEDSL